MGEKITREVYIAYAKKISSVLNGEGFFEQFKKRVDNGASSVKLCKKHLIQDISLDWITTIEDVLPNLDTIVRNPRKFIIQEEDIVDISLARSISTESVKHLAQHTNMISKVDKDGSVTPNKILNITKEESFEIYENRFIYTLLLKLKDFVTMRYDKIKKASATQDILEMDVESRFSLPTKKVTFRTEYFAQLSFDEVMRLDPDTLTKIERVAKIDRIITDFLSSSFCKSMKNSAPVRPPITRTNVILKNPDFKKALTLWQFIETYQISNGFSTSDDVEDYEVTDEDTERLKNMVTLNTMVFESMYNQCESNMDMADVSFEDFLRVGNMDFQKDNIQHDEYAQKPDNEKLNEEEIDNVDNDKPKEDNNHKNEVTSQEKENNFQEIETPIEQNMETPFEQEVETPAEKEIPQNYEHDDEEPDADKFDQNLFDVRKLFKRPDDDRIKQEEIIKVKDAIDRCLNAYRKIKQEEIEERDRQDRIRRRKEDIEKRAQAFRKQRDAILAENKENESAYFGIDPFGYQKAKISTKLEKENKKNALHIRKHERLELEDKNTESIKQSIEQMEAENANFARKNAEIDRKLDAIDAIFPLNKDAAIVEEKSIVVTKKQRVNKPKKQEKKFEYTMEANADSIVENNSFSNLGNSISEDNKQNQHAQNVDVATVKPNIRFASNSSYNSWGLSATTINQKYSMPSGKKKIIKPVDEKKVAVGDIHIEESEIIDPYAELEKIKHRPSKKSKVTQVDKETVANNTSVNGSNDTNVTAKIGADDNQ